MDPSLQLHGRYDVGVRAGRITEVARTIDPTGWGEVVDVGGRIVTPGLIDLHVHAFEGVSHFGIDVDRYCLSRGSTTVLDTGSAGAQTFPGFRRYVIEQKETRIRALLNISATGMVTNLRGELRDLVHANVERAIDAIEANRDLILGVKVRAGAAQSGGNDRASVELALQVAEVVGLPMMMHIANTVSPIDQLLELLRPGDVLTHSFLRSGTAEFAGQGILTAQGVLRDSAREALARGVFFDVGHGQGSFSFDVAEKAIDQGIMAGLVISSDVHAYNVGAGGPVYDLATTLSKFLQMGLSLDEVVACSTSVPASALPWGERLGSLEVGAAGDLAVFELQPVEARFVDSYGGTRVGTQRLVPWRTIRGGQSFLPRA